MEHARVLEGMAPGGLRGLKVGSFIAVQAISQAPHPTCRMCDRALSTQNPS